MNIKFLEIKINARKILLNILIKLLPLTNKHVIKLSQNLDYLLVIYQKYSYDNYLQKNI